MSNIVIDAGFDSGSIDVMTVHQASAMLRLKPDTDSEFKQWFHFRVANAGGRELVLKIVGLNDSAYPAGCPLRLSTPLAGWGLAAPRRCRVGLSGGFLRLLVSYMPLALCRLASAFYSPPCAG